MKDFIAEQYADLHHVAQTNKAGYEMASPFPSMCFKNFFNPQILDGVIQEFPDLDVGDALRFDKPKEKKLAAIGEARFGDHTRKFMHYLNSQPFLEFLQELTGIKEVLISDPYFSGAGLHETRKGGLLKIHADFNKHPQLHLDRRLNVLIYLNKDWKEEYGGHFEFWDREMKQCERRVAPDYNTLVIFSTTDFSYHGHPDPLNCPDDRSRKSLALYYYSNGRPQEEINAGAEKHNTLFQERKDNVSDKEAFTKWPFFGRMAKFLAR